MTKNEMYTKIAEASGVSKANVEEVIKALSDELLEVIAANDSFKLGDVVTIKGVDSPLVPVVILVLVRRLRFLLVPVRPRLCSLKRRESNNN